MEQLDWLDRLNRSFAIPINFFAGVQPHVPALDALGGQRAQRSQVLRKPDRNMISARSPALFTPIIFSAACAAG